MSVTMEIQRDGKVLKVEGEIITYRSGCEGIDYEVYDEEGKIIPHMLISREEFDWLEELLEEDRG